MRIRQFLSAMLMPALLILSACAMGRVDTHRPPAPVMRAMPDVFDCLRERRLALVSAHRGQKDPMAAENSIASFADTIERGPIFIEVDVSRSADGVLMLMHDQTLDRTTTGLGPLAGYSYQQLRRAWLKDGKGAITDERIPTLEEALVWARRNGGVLQLDIKPGVPLADVLEQVREQRMENQVILIAYSLADVRNFQRAAPEMMISASGRNASENAAILAMANPRMLFFTGVAEPDPALIARLDAAGVEAITGTLGKAGERLDDRYLADGNASEYAALAERGVALIASDQPVVAWRALKSADRDGTICLLGVKQ
ncbi:glycerophosphodiester phosphodiesterase family protein [Sandaracinobacter neustonicus]|uniref:Glycerophosphodiester phosphodiesterase family protein n=1 Tax=Sandaracinobacter neustonicus TaxID=1715348 RepID=A0A501XR44_9SPHN|nr:glycerophosphodiester phosphodiesterase family protein [Sandaracinobacter neustonicus]TPE62869.1 glycerophosphodiester phosphodiesterase family protein [Sandaracinobacter neustonicus]